MNIILDKYRALTEREQMLVAISGVVMVIAILYWGIFAPLNTGIEREQTRLSSQQKLLEWVSERANRAQQLRQAAGSGNQFRGSLPQAVNSTTNRFKIAISRMQPQGEELQVWVDQAPFNDVLSWLQAMESMGIVILNADIAEADASGQIKIRRLQLGKA
ncbi:type II secretion system protein M [Alteromonas sp. ASW11-130]|uniref:type II secretion system protein M n=1 Tax=Alteromonas sp. ASW11-130 TaxID=3015775 RepID=UPI002241F979|nr:type II secretion system protein M [Alteromonas sp. ASW11-130]MCW8093277.1 type II secretion system protein M [Alteromonas sp. ASW11-130]